MILRPLRTSPFLRYPQLLQIWDKRREVMRQAVEYYITDPGIEQKFLMMNQDGFVVGITGYFLAHPTGAGLAWHGVVPEHQGKGYSTAALDMLEEEILSDKNYIGVAELVEFIPEDRQHDLVPYFTKLGFVAAGIETNPEFVTQDVVWTRYIKKIG